MSKTLQLSLDDDLATDISRTSKEMGLTNSEFIQQLIEERLLNLSLDSAEKDGQEFSSEEVFEPLRKKYRNMLENS